MLLFLSLSEKKNEYIYNTYIQIIFYKFVSKNIPKYSIYVIRTKYHRVCIITRCTTNWTNGSTQDRTCHSVVNVFDTMGLAILVKIFITATKYANGFLKITMKSIKYE